MSVKKNVKRRGADMQIVVLSEQVSALNDKMDEHMVQMQTLVLRFNDHILEYTKYKGFLGGMLFVFSALWIFFKFVMGDLKSAIGKLFGAGA